MLCPKCGKEMRKNGTNWKWMGTKPNKVQVRYQNWQCKHDGWTKQTKIEE